jgi:hypothetical protein
VNQRYGCAEGATGTRKPFKAEKSWKSAPDSVYRRNAIPVARIFGPQKLPGFVAIVRGEPMRIISGLSYLLFGLLAFAQTPPASSKAPAVSPPQGVWAKLDQTLNTSFTRAGDKISAVLQDEVALKDLKLPKGTKLTGIVQKSVNQDKQHPSSGLVLLFDTAMLKGGTIVPVQVMMASIAPSLSDEVEQVFVGSGQVTDATMRAANEMGGMADPNQSITAHSSTKVNGVVATSSIKGVALFVSPNGKSSGVVVGLTGPLQLTKWTRINVVVSAP